MNFLRKNYDKITVAISSLLVLVTLGLFLSSIRNDGETQGDVRKLDAKNNESFLGSKKIEEKDLIKVPRDLEMSRYKSNRNFILQNENGSGIFFPGQFIICNEIGCKNIIPFDTDICPVCGEEQLVCRPETFETDSDEGGIRDDLELRLTGEQIVKRISEALNRKWYFDIKNPSDDNEDPDCDGFTNAEELIGWKGEGEREYDPFNQNSFPALANLLRMEKCEPLFIPITVRNMIVMDEEDPTSWEVNLAATLIGADTSRQAFPLNYAGNNSVRQSSFSKADIRLKIGDRIFDRIIALKHSGNRNFNIRKDYKIVNLSLDNEGTIEVQEVALENGEWKPISGVKYKIDRKNNKHVALNNEYLITLNYLVDRIVASEEELANKTLVANRCMALTMRVDVNNPSNTVFSLITPRLISKMKNTSLVRHQKRGVMFRGNSLAYGVIQEELKIDKDPELERYTFVKLEEGKYPVLKSDKDGRLFTIKTYFDPKKDLVIPNSDFINEVDAESSEKTKTGGSSSRPKRGQGRAKPQ